MSKTKKSETKAVKYVKIKIEQFLQVRCAN